MAESLILFESVINSRWFLRTSIILFLNKIDIFKAKLEAGIRLAKYIVSYGSRPNDYENTSSCAYFVTLSRNWCGTGG